MEGLIAGVWLTLLMWGGHVWAAPLPPEPDPKPAATEEGPSPEDLKLAASLHPQTGRIDLVGSGASLQTGTRFVFFGPADARKIIVEGWGNPPETADSALGIIFPADAVFPHDRWGAVITYESTGYVSDETASKQEYDKLLAEMRRGEDEDNAQRRKDGYPAVKLVGWAPDPSYDRAHHSLTWGRELAFEGMDEHSLNYDVRLLGRKGVLNINVVGLTRQLPQIQAVGRDLASAARFNNGSRYVDYTPGDQRAAYGLVGLVGMGAGLVVAKQAGLLAAIALVAKKAIVLIGAMVLGAVNWIRSRFRRKGGGTPPGDVPPED